MCLTIPDISASLSDESWSDSLALFAWSLARLSELSLFLFESPGVCWIFTDDSNLFDAASASGLLVLWDISGLSDDSLWSFLFSKLVSQQIMNLTPVEPYDTA